MTVYDFYVMSSIEKKRAAKEMPNDELQGLMVSWTNVINLSNQFKALYNELHDFDKKAAGLIASIKRKFSAKTREESETKRKAILNKIAAASRENGYADMEAVWNYEIDAVLAKYPNVKSEDIAVRNYSLITLSSNIKEAAVSILVKEAESR